MDKSYQNKQSLARMISQLPSDKQGDYMPRLKQATNEDALERLHTEVLQSLRSSGGFMHKRGAARSTK